MSDILSLPLGPRKIVWEFVRRSEFWLRVPGNERRSFWEMDNPDQPLYLFTAFDVVQFTKAHSLAAIATNDDELLRVFKEKLRADWGADQATPYEEARIARVLGDYLLWIDRIFFFGLLTRPTKREGELVAERPIVALQPESGLVDADGKSLNGRFVIGTGKLLVSTRRKSGKLQLFPKALAIVVHELVHAYLHILVRDDEAARYFRDIDQDSGHGIQFQTLLQFILLKLFEWVPTMKYLRGLAILTRVDLRAALARPPISEDVARSLIYPEEAWRGSV
ncbi:hypothetical protein SAMD00023353_0100940 [Rosellinia necatrix]|uniref:Uncharacterized protein n=1 Tax=Rosellinia necatrix TaxID=77044 RepID=A0A1S7UJU1_ROSNE|nr:hypothetical protein SAMD00023353_0100940 [Rosellinia necatrix]